MAEDVKGKQDNPCCLAWKKKCLELNKKFKEFKQELRLTTSTIQPKFDALENEILNLKNDKEKLERELSDVEMRWKNEKEMGTGIRVDLENEVTDLKDEIRELKEKGSVSGSEGEIERMKDLLEKEKERADLERKKVEKLEKEKSSVNSYEGEIKRLKDLLEKEKGRADLEKKNGELQRKKVEKLEKEKSKASEVQRVANVERRKAEENVVLLEKLKKEIDGLNKTVGLERSKSEVASKKLEAEEKKVVSERKRADLAIAKAEEQRKLAETNMKKAEEYKLLWEKMKLEVNAEKSKSEAVYKQVEVEKEKTNIEKKKAELAIAKAEEQKKLAETYLEKVKFEKDKTDDLNKKLEEERNKVKRLEKELHQLICAPDTGRIVEPTTDICTGMVINELTASQWTKLLFEKDQNIIREKNRADSESKKARKREKDAKEHKKMAAEQRHQADSLVRELEGYKLRLEEYGNKPQELLPYRLNNADVSLIGNNNVMYENERLKLLNEELELQKMLVRNANEAKNLEVRRNSVLNQELLLVKQESLQSQQRLDMLVDSFQNDGEGILEHEKMGKRPRGEFYTDQSHMQLTSGTDSILNHPCRGCKRNILPNSAIHSSSASISDQTLMGSAKMGEDGLDLEPTISNLCGMKRTRSPIRGKSNGSIVGHNDTGVIRDVFDKGHKDIPEKLSQLHGLLSDKKDDPTTEILEENSGEHIRPIKKKKPSCNGAIVVHPLHESGNLVAYSDNGEACASPLTDQHIATEGDGLAIDDYMKLLDLDNPVDEESYCRAIASPESPLCPTLTDIEFCGDDEPTNLVLNDIVTSQLQREDDSVAQLQNTGVLQAGHAHFHLVENDETNKSCEKSVLMKYCVIPSDNSDVNSILRILQTIRSCVPQCSVLDTPDLFLRNLLTDLVAKDISMKEQVCAFFCILLHTVSEAGTGDLTDALSSDFVQLLASITRPICSALSDPALQKFFMVSCDLLELLALLVDFIEHRKVLVYAEASAKTSTLHKPKLNLDLNGSATSVYEQSASAHQLVVASSLFASICSGVDHIRFVCEISCNIFSKDKFEPATSLAILHAFAHTCGSQYFTLHDYPPAMTVVKSLVMHLEKQTQLTNSAPKCEVWSCSAGCPFSEGALCVNDVASLLLNKLQVYVQSVSWIHGSKKGHKNGDSAPTDVGKLSNAPDDRLFSFMNIVSLVEILASFMGWEWTTVNFVAQVCEMLGSCLMDDSSAAIAMLLGQLGRLGVTASGYESTGVEELRERLSAFLSQSNFSKLSLVTQFALMTALLGVTPINFEELIQSRDDATVSLSKSIDASFVKKWFSLLSIEQQSVFQSSAL